MKRILLAIAILPFLAAPCVAEDPIQLARMNPYVLGAVPVIAAPSCSLLDAGFESADGTEYSVLDPAWTADGSVTANRFEADTAQYTAGAASLKIDMHGDEKIYIAFTEQTTGTFTVTMNVRIGAWENTTKALGFFTLSDGAYSWASTNTTDLQFDAGYLQYRNSSAWTNVAAVVADTWYEIVLTLDMTNNQIDINVDGGAEEVTDGSFHNNTDPDRAYFTSIASDGDPGASATVWIDELCID